MTSSFGRGPFLSAGTYRYRFTAVGPQKNPWQEFPGGAAFARIIVGFNVGKRAAWTANALERLWLRVRRAQHAAAAATFSIQRGIYEHSSGHGLVREDGATISVLHLDGSPAAKWRRALLAAAEELAGLMKQESVIVELGKAGVVETTAIVTPKAKKKRAAKR